MKAFKHVPLEFADAFAAGTSIQIASLEYYRRLENDRADQLEGVAEYVVPVATPEQLGSEDYADIREALMLPRAPIHLGSYVGNVARHVSPPHWVFCASLQPDLGRSVLGEAVFEISNLDLFAHRVSMRSPTHLGCMAIQPVSYEQRSQNPFEAGLLHVDPFKKDINFQFENEVRVVWSCAAPRGALPSQVGAPKVATLIRRLA